MSAEERITELETEVDKLILLVLQQQQDIEDIDDRQFKLLRLIGRRLGLTQKKARSRS